MKIYTSLKEWFKQLLRYGFIGILVNVSGYLFYLIVTWFGVTPQLVVTIMYPLVAVYGYFAHARLSFKYTGNHYIGMLKYVIIHLIGYAVNMLLLHYLYGVHGYPHQWVQALAILVVGIFLFLSFRYFVFKNSIFKPK